MSVDRSLELPRLHELNRMQWRQLHQVLTDLAGLCLEIAAVLDSDGFAASLMHLDRLLDLAVWHARSWLGRNGVAQSTNSPA